ncbi:MAG: hypothetical protein Roseis2KO_10220 [Roseivirga sp.]
MKRSVTYLLTAFAILATVSCSPQSDEPLKINGFQLSSQNPDALAKWYVRNLGFSSSEHNGSLILSNKFNQIDISGGKLNEGPSNGQRTAGFFKIGFKTNDLDGLYARLQENGTEFRGDIFYDSNLKTRSLVSLDSDGNRVQFFEDANVIGLTSYFFSVMAMDFEKTKAWCESKFGFVETYNLDLPDRGISIRLLQKDGVLLELISDKQLVSANTEIPGIHSVLFNRSKSRLSAGKLIFSAPMTEQTPR